MIEKRTVFLSAPFSQWLDPRTRLVSGANRQCIELVRDALVSQGMSVFSPHFNEAWGKRWLQPHECTPADFAAISRADGLVAFLGEPISTGVAIELGWASMRRLPIVMIYRLAAELSPLIEGLDAVTDTAHVPYRGEHPALDPDLPKVVVSRLRELLNPSPGVETKYA